MRWRRHWHQFQYWLEDSNFLSSGFLTGLPAFVGAILIVVVCLLANQAHSTNRHVPRYAAAVAGAEDDSKTQQLFLRKLISCEPENAAYRFALIKTDGFDSESAERVLRQLAPDDGHGFAAAHLLRAKAISEKSILTVGDLSLMKHHASEALKGQLGKVGTGEKSIAEAKGILGYVLSHNDNNEEALPYLRDAADLLPQYRLPAARLSVKLGDLENAEHYGLMAEREYGQALKDDPTDLATRLEFIQAQMFLGKYQEADRSLAEGDFENVDVSTKELVMRIHLALWDLIEGESSAAIGGRIRLLQRALLVNSEHSGVLHRLTKVVLDDADEAEIARRILRQQLVVGQAPASVHLMLGTAALRGQEAENATFHLQQALRLNPNSAKTISALALSYIQTDHPALDKALALMQSLPDHCFENPEVRGIRGQVLLKANRIEEAIADLESALKETPGSVAVREALSEVYTNLGKAELAQMHQNILSTRPRSPGFKPIIEPLSDSTDVTRDIVQMSRDQENSEEFPKPVGAPGQIILEDDTRVPVTPKVLSHASLSKRLTISHSRMAPNLVNRPSLRESLRNRGMGS